MKNLKTKKISDLISVKPLIALGTLGVLVAAPGLMSVDTAEAKPPSHAKAKGHDKNKKNKKAKKDKKDKNRDNDNDDDNDTNDSAITIEGRVISVASSRQIVVRGDNGRTYTVTSRNSFSSDIDRGDRVRVNGRLTSNSRITTDRVTLVQDNDGDNGDNDDNDNGQTVDFRGTVQADVVGNTISVRGDNGQTYTVRLNNDSNYNRGERVRVVGSYVNGVVVATSITRL